VRHEGQRNLDHEVSILIRLRDGPARPNVSTTIIRPPQHGPEQSHSSAGRGSPTLVGEDATLRRVVEPATLGDPMHPLLWVSKSRDKLAAALCGMGHKISAVSVKRLLPTLGYSRRSNRKTDEEKKNWSATTRTAVRIIVPKAIRDDQLAGWNGCACSSIAN
jgi:hypothetical protein